MEFEADPRQDGRLRLRRRMLWLPGDSPVEAAMAEGKQPFAVGLAWAVDGMAGAVSFNVVLGGARSGRSEHAVPLDDHPAEGNQDIGRELLAKWWVEVGLRADGVHVHAYRPWPTTDGGDEDPTCPFLEDRCWSQVVSHDREPRTHELLTRLVQPGGTEYCYEHLEAVYRAEFAPALSEQALLAKSREEGARAALARADVVPGMLLANEAVVTMTTPFDLDMGALFEEDSERWVRIVEATEEPEGGLFVVQELPNGETSRWELRRDRSSRIRWPEPASAS